MLPGKKYRAEDCLRIAWRFKWVIVASFALVTSATAVYTSLLPDRYRADEMIEVVPQRVSQAYVRSTVTLRLEDRLGAIGQRVMSRTSLERVIRDFNLYGQERQTMVMEDVVERMRKNDIEMVAARADAFRLSFYSVDPRKAKQVTERLASLIIDESLQDRSGYADSTTEFLASQLENARRALNEQDQRLADYQRRHAGTLPSERQSNIQVLQNLQMQVQAIVESINRDRDSRHLVERQLADAIEAPGPSAQPVIVGDDPTALGGSSPVAQLEIARNQLRAMELRLTPDHPDVKRLKSAIRELEGKVAAEAAERAKAPGTGLARPATPEEQARQKHIAELQGELARLDVQLRSKEATEKRLRAEIGSFEGRVSATPIREAELTGLTRDYDTLRKNYEGLLAKYEDAKVAANLEHREIGEQFKVLDAARVPQAPISPNRPFLNMIGALAGLGLGFALVVALEYSDRSVRTEDDVVLCLSLPVLALVPDLKTRADLRRERRRKALVSCAAAALVLVAVSGAFAWKLGWLTGLIAW